MQEREVNLDEFVSRLEEQPDLTDRLGHAKKIHRMQDILFLLVVALLAIIFLYDGCGYRSPQIPAPVIKQQPASFVPSVPKDVHKQYGGTPTDLKADAPPGSYKLKVQATAYWTHDPVDASGHGIAYDGTPAVAYKTCAVDPKVIPLGSKVYVKEFGWLRANDTGNAIKGHIIDIAMPDRKSAWAWGRRNIEVFVTPPKGA